jgi:AcrR family transcriptional regulator
MLLTNKNNSDIILTFVITTVNIRRHSALEKKISITREQIISTALDLMRNKNELRTVNMREIARTLGCAHTNIYNYFSSYTELLWDTHTALLEHSMNILRERLSDATTAEMELRYFFDTFIQVYFDNKGWFRLAWLEYIGDARPQSNTDMTVNVHLELNRYITTIWEEMTSSVPDSATVNRVIHNTHCYIIGEISNYISGRGLIENESELKEYIKNEAINIFTLCMRKE